MANLPIHEKLNQSIKEITQQQKYWQKRRDNDHEFSSGFRARATLMQGLFGRVLFEATKAGKISEEVVDTRYYHPARKDSYESADAVHRALYHFAGSEDGFYREFTPAIAVPHTTEVRELKSIIVERIRPAKFLHEVKRGVIKVPDIRKATYIAKLIAEKDDSTATQLADLTYEYKKVEDKPDVHIMRFGMKKSENVPIEDRETTIASMDFLNNVLGAAALSLAFLEQD